MRKYLKIISNVFRSFSLPIFSFILSIVGIQYFGKQNWGEFIYVLTIINFFAFLGNFGNKDFLLRKYSKHPSKIKDYFTTSLSSRILLLIFSLTMFFLVSAVTALFSVLLILLIYIYQSFDSLIIYHQKFLSQLIAEIVGFTIIIISFSYDFNFETKNILLVYIISFIFKISYITFILRKDITFLKFNFSITELEESFPFFLIIFSGWMASKIDLYIVNFKLSSGQIAEYQIAVTAFLLLQSLSYLLILPFSKHIYRLPKKTIKKIKINLGILSIPIIVLGSFGICILLEYFMNINLKIIFYIIGALSCFPTFFFIVDILTYYRDNKEKKILKINIISSIINLTLTLFLIDKFEIIGAISSVLITNFMILIFYKLNLFDENSAP